MKVFIVFLVVNVLNVYSDENTRSNENIQKASNNATVNPCIYIEPQKPDFLVPGRRISEAKCYEYIWDLKKRADDVTKDAECVRWLIKQGKPVGNTFVIGGDSVEPGDYPHMGALGWKAKVGTWIFKCGSTLISAKFLLTAAHCSRLSSRDTSVANPVPEIVRLGDKNIIDLFANDRPPVDVKIKRIVNHPNYKSPNKYYDIALIEAMTNVLFTKFIQPACLWTKHDTSPLGTRANLTGWGVVETGGRTTSPELRAAQVEIINSDYCDDLLRFSHGRLWRGVETHQLCAGNLTGGVDACQGDSGGPLQMRIPIPVTSQGAMHYVIGVTSFGIGCARPDVPAIYTRVSSFIDWIEDVVWRGL